MNTPRRAHAMLGLALLAFIFPLYAFLRWAFVFDANQPREEMLDAFFAGFPAVLRPRGALELVSAGACLLTVVLASMALRRHTGVARALTAALIGLATLMGFWYLFTLM